MKILYRSLLAGLMVIFFVGCATTYQVQVDALAAPQADTLTTFVLEQPAGTRDGSRLRYMESADLIARALEARGWSEATEAGNADIIISLEAKVSDPLTKTQLRSEPLYYRSWGQTRTIRTAVRDKNGNVVRYVRSNVYLPPRRELVGYRDIAYNVTVYEKSLNLMAHDTTGEEIWTITVRMVDTSSDLRKYLPLLASAALPYIGETTDGEIVVKVSEDDETLMLLRGSEKSK